MSFGDLRASHNYVWDCTKALGQGATSKVYKGRCKNTGEEVAVKVFTTAGSSRPVDIQLREFSVMRKLRHENIVQLIAIEEESSGNKIIVMELSKCGSLYTVLDEPENSFGLAEEEFLLVVKHVAAGMRYLRQNDIVHRDIKPGNILRYKGEDGRSVYKLTDFGAARQLEHEDEQFTSLYGTEEYLHPNIYGRAVMKSPDVGPFDATVDLWSLGVTFYHAATGQLPFRPYGGRKNKHTMYDIITEKESGVISGVQKSERGAIEWSKELPPTCVLSDGLKKLCTQILARLLESNAKKKWNFEAFFAEVERLMSLAVVHVFSPVTWSSLRIYISKDSKLSKLKELIAEQCEIAAVNQLLIFERELFEVRVDPLTPINNYPKSIGPSNPVYVYLKIHPDRRGFPSAIYPEYPRFGGTNNIGNDYQLAKTCCAVMCYQRKLIEVYHTKERLIRQSVHNYIHELHHEITHLVDYLKHQKQHSDTCKMWFHMFRCSVAQNLRILSMNIHDSVKSRAEQLSRLLSQEQQHLSNAEKQTLNTLMTASEQLKEMENHELNHRMLEKQWRDDLGCNVDVQRCAERIDVMVETVQKIVRHFKEHRQSRILDHNTESIHTFEKNKLQELCSRCQSIMESCYKNSEKQYNYYYKWFRQAIDTRFLCDSINMHLAHLEDDQSQFAHKVEQSSSRMNQSMSEIIVKIPPVLVVHPVQPTVSAGRGANIMERISNGLQMMGNECEELSSRLNRNNELINRSCQEISSSTLDDKDGPS